MSEDGVMPMQRIVTFLDAVSQPCALLYTCIPQPGHNTAKGKGLVVFDRSRSPENSVSEILAGLRGYPGIYSVFLIFAAEGFL
jgi:hypothetical protein